MQTLSARAAFMAECRKVPELNEAIGNAAVLLRNIERYSTDKQAVRDVRLALAELGEPTALVKDNPL